MYAPFGAREKTPTGYVVDVKNQSLSCSRLPIIITDANFVCGRRIVFGASDVAEAIQIIASLLIAQQNVISSIEAPRFNMLLNGSVGIESKLLKTFLKIKSNDLFSGGRTPLFKADTIQYLEALGDLFVVKEPYNSCNIIEKSKDELNSHSDSRGGGIASRF